MKRTVTRAKLHDLQVVVPGIGSLEKDLPPRNKTLDMVMEEGLSGVELIIKGVQGVIVIPYANVQVYFTAPEAVVVPEAKVKK